jgi:DNA (cytosine-5)-methyltransferase 1
MNVRYVDLFAGIGGFHAAATAFGWECVFASENDPSAARIYQQNWKMDAFNDITEVANDRVMKVPPHDVLFGGFPCQPFSKSGKQLGMDETRGTLFWNILKIIQMRRPALVVLENVRNIAGPQHRHEWEVIISQLKELDYRVSEKPFVVSPHKIRKSAGGRPQIRERVFIVATRIDDKKMINLEFSDLKLRTDAINADPQSWNLTRDLPLQTKVNEAHQLNAEELEIIQVWEKLVKALFKSSKGTPLPGFPLWTDFWTIRKTRDEDNFPEWKKNFVSKNRNFYKTNKKVIDTWKTQNPQFSEFPPSRRKFEWQAQDSQSIWDCIIHFRPSGVRVKKPTYVPALVAITQTSILGFQKRRLALVETARLQGFPDWFDLGGQPESAAFKQLGNGVSIGAVYQVLRSIADRDFDLLEISCPKILKSLNSAPISPDPKLKKISSGRVPKQHR